MTRIAVINPIEFDRPEEVQAHVTKWLGSREFEEHPILALPLIRHKQLKKIKAWINGIALNVQRYSYPRNRGLACYYADLVGSGAHGGKNEFVIYLQY